MSAASQEQRPSDAGDERVERRPGARDPAAGYRRIAWSLIMLVLVPSALLIVVGVLLLVRGSHELNLVLGILVLLFCGCLATGITLVWVFLAKEQNLSQLQTDFVSKMSHELKTPLTSIRLFAETLAMKRMTDQKQIDECHELLARETERLTDRIDRLLDWGRMEAGRRVYDLRPDTASAIVSDAIDHFAPLQIKADDVLEVKVDEGLPKVRADRAALSSALLNLLTNAHKYGGRPRKITLRATSDRARGVVILAVTDNGEGIPLHEHKRIFQKFYRRDDRLSRTSEGSGLGLAIVSHVVKGHRGKITVDSSPGRGTTFSITLPALE